MSRPPVVARSAHPVEALQRRLGNQGTGALIARATSGVGAEKVRACEPLGRPQAAGLHVSSPGDPSEREATAVASAIMRMPLPAPAKEVAAPAAAPLQRSPAASASASGTSPSAAAGVHVPVSGGMPLAAGVRGFMEPRFGADFGRVQVHTGEQAATMSRQLNAKAFTVGNHVFFGRGEYKPDTNAGRELIAHELTHTIQQRAVVQRSEAPPVSERMPLATQRLGIGDALDYFASKAHLIPGFRMLTLILGVNPINMSPVERSAANVLRALVELLPGGNLIVQALENSGIFDRVGGWVAQQIASLGLVGARIKTAVTTFLGTLKWSDIFDLGGVWERAKTIFTDPITRVVNLAKSLVAGIVQLVKQAILMPLAQLASQTRGWDLLIAVLGRNPITGDPVPRNADTLIGGFLKLIGQQEVWENIKRANAIQRTWAWFQGALGSLIGFVAQIPTLAMDAFRSLEIVDIVLVPRAFAKIAGVFGGFLGSFVSWAGGAVWNLLEIVFEAVSPKALAYIKRTGSALRSILRNPLPFVGNLVRAAKLGFQNFATNFVNHLKAGLISWLTGALPGVYIPQAFTLGEIVKLVFSVLGISWQNIRQKLVKVVGETAVNAMETGFDVVVTLVTQGPAAAWEKIKEQLGNLKDTVIGGITDFVVDTVVKKAIPKLLSMFIPGAGFISAIMSIYDTIMVFVNKLSQIAAVVTGFVDSIVAIAGGAIGAAADRVEQSLAGILSLAINFLAGFVGLGDVAQKVMGVIGKVRATVDKALDALIGWIVTSAKRLFARAVGGPRREGGVDTRSPHEKERDLGVAVDEATAFAELHADDVAAIKVQLVTLRTRYRLASLDLGDDGGGSFHVEGQVNPRKTGRRFRTIEGLLGAVPLGARAAVREAIGSAKDKQRVAQRIFDKATSERVVRASKTMAFGDEITISGWGTYHQALTILVRGRQILQQAEGATAVWDFVKANEKALKMEGYEIKPFVFDPREAKGAYHASHAEKQALLSALSRLDVAMEAEKKRAILSLGVTRPMCEADCFPFFRAVAVYASWTIVLADPKIVWVFLPNGGVLQKTWDVVR